jgi:hypothetical protein
MSLQNSLNFLYFKIRNLALLAGQEIPPFGQIACFPNLHYTASASAETPEVEV